MIALRRLYAPALLLVVLPGCFTGGIGGPEMLVIAGVLLLLFGGSKLPELMRGMGSGISEFKKGLREGAEDDEDGKKEEEPKELDSGS